MRIDQLIVQRGMVPTRSAAQRLIERKAVRWLGPKGWLVPTKSGEDVPDDAKVEITDDAELRFVSRGGLKLEGAVARCGFSVAGRTCLDVGQSTGGFTDVLLARGAARVVGLDVGHGQLHPRLRGDARVTALEGVNARHLVAADLGAACPAEGFGFITGDLSFISLALVLPALAPLLAPAGDLLMLVKPQFELQPGDIGKGGLVKDTAALARVEPKLREAAAGCGLAVAAWLDSPVTGGDGNREFLMHARRAG